VGGGRESRGFRGWGRRRRGEGNGHIATGMNGRSEFPESMQGP